MEFISTVFDWFRDPDNRGAVQVLAAVAVIVVAWATGLLRSLVGLFAPEAQGACARPGPRQTASGGGVITPGQRPRHHDQCGKD